LKEIRSTFPALEGGGTLKNQNTLIYTSAFDRHFFSFFINALNEAIKFKDKI